MRYDKVKSLDNTEWLYVRSSRVGGPPTKGSRGSGQAFGNYYNYISKDGGKTWLRIALSSFMEIEALIKSNNDADIVSSYGVRF